MRDEKLGNPISLTSNLQVNLLTYLLKSNFLTRK